MTPKKIWDKTAGYKTKSGAILYLLLQIFKKLFPEFLDDATLEIVKYIIDFTILTGGIDWIWRNRKEIIQWIGNLFKKK